MSRRTLLLITALALTTAILIVMAISPKKTTTPSTQTGLAPSPKAVAQTTLFLSPNPLIISSLPTASPSALDVKMNTGANLVTAVQLELSYDPTLLSVVDIAPSSFFKNPVVLLKIIDSKNGKITYALGIPPGETPKKKAGSVVTLTFRTQMIPANVSRTEIKFLPKTMVTALGVTSSVLKTTRETSILFTKEATPSPLQLNIKTP